MNKQIIICALFLSFFLVSCWSNPQYETAKGENIIPKDTLELMIYDIHLADAIITAKIMKTDKSSSGKDCCDTKATKSAPRGK